MEIGDGIRAWLFLRQVAEYRAAWTEHAAPPDAPGTERDPDGVEPDPEPGEPAGQAPDRREPVPATEPGGQAFPIRVQTRADLAAARFDLLAWRDPRGEGGPASPFWVQEGMTEAAIAPDAAPLADMVAADGGSVEGLRLLDGALVLKIEFDGRAVQLLLRDAGPFPPDAGIELRTPFGLRLPHGMRRLLDFWEVAGRSPPPP